MFKKNNIIIGCITMILIIISLGNIFCSSNTIEETEYEFDVLVFCDLTFSIDSSSVSTVAKHLSKLITNLPSESEVTVYPIDCYPVEPIATGCLPEKGTSYSEEMLYNKKVKQMAKSVVNKAVDLQKKRYSGNTSSCSCILSSFNIAYNHFNEKLKQYKKKNKRQYYDLIYISDMLEDCNDPSIGDYDFRRQSLEAVKKEYSKYNPTVDLSFARLKVILISDPNPRGQRSVMSQTQLMDVWKELFGRAGFTKRQLDTWHFEPGYPSCFKDSTYWYTDPNLSDADNN